MDTPVSPLDVDRLPLAVIATFIALAQEKPIVWVSYVPLLPLALLLLTGLHTFLLPYVAKWRGGQRAG